MTIRPQIDFLIAALAAASRPTSPRRRVLHRLRAAYAKGGWHEVVRRSRVRLAKAIYPGELKIAKKTSSKRSSKTTIQPPPPPAAVLNAIDVTHQQAMTFFERRRPTYERLAQRVAPYLDPDDLILDVGGNVGYFTLVLGEVVGLRGTVHLFEPVPHLARLCETTLRDAQFRAVIHPYGLAEADATTHIYLATDGNLGWNTLVAKRAKGMTEVPIELRAFDLTLVDKPPSLIKIDVEGAEHRVLRGLWSALESWHPRPVILCEIGWGVAHPEWQEELAVLQRLVTELGYRAESMDGAPIEVATVARTTDVLFVPAT